MDREMALQVSEYLVENVQAMQDYISEHVDDEDFIIEHVYTYIRYSKRHCERIFKMLTNLTLQEYIRAIQLSQSVNKLLEENNSILNIALETNYESHEGYTRAFRDKFGISPNKYRRNPVPIPMFVQYPVRAYYSFVNNKEDMKMHEDCLICMVTVVKRPERKLIVLRSKNAQDYWSYCEEIGCQWDGLFNSIPEKLDTAAILELPDHLIKEGTSRIAAGVELPLDYNGSIPIGCEVVELPACDFLYFQSEPFEKEEDFGKAIDCVFRAIDRYDVARYGYEYAFELAPKFNYGASTHMGAKQALPVRKLV